MTSCHDAILSSLAESGYAIADSGLTSAEALELAAALEPPRSSSAAERGGVRDLFTVAPLVRNLAGHPGVRRWPAAVLGSQCFAVRAILFDKTPEANWKVTWHQDTTIAVAERVAVDGFGPWSRKAGVIHAQAPAALLGRMLAVRLHLDACGPENGPLRVLPGSHRHGILDATAIACWRSRRTSTLVTCPATGVVLMRPLLLHASSPAVHPQRRRVIHLEYAAESLPAGLRWREQWGGQERITSAGG